MSKLRRNERSRLYRRGNVGLLETLENRLLLACDLLPGDANEDCHFDQADFILAMEGGKFETGEEASWSEGDWSGDGIFTSVDFVVVFAAGNYLQGPAEGATNEPVNTLAPLADSGEASVTLFYLPESGDLFAVADGFMTTLHLRSQSDSFDAGPPSDIFYQSGPFDISTSSDLFHLSPAGYGVFQMLSALPTGWTQEQVQQDLSVTGSLYEGGNLGTVRLGNPADLPAGLPFEGEPPGGNGVQNSVGNNPDPDPDPDPDPPVVGLAAGDANEDGYVDPADFIQAMKAQTFDVPTQADWASGDWNGDQQFDAKDLIVVFQEGHYMRGAYRDDAGPPVHQLTTISAPNEEADVTVHYDAESGDVTVASHSGLLTTLHLRSSGTFESLGLPGIFDVSNAYDVFTIQPEGVSAIRFAGLMPTGLPVEVALGDLLVDGSTLGGGGLGTAAIGTPDQLPEVPTEEINTGRPPSESDYQFVDIDEADAVMIYDASTGDVTINAVESPFVAFEMTSASESFVGTTTNDYTIGLFDVALPHKFFRLEPQGMNTIELLGFMRPGMTESELTDDIRHNGAMLGGGPLKLALAQPSFPARVACIAGMTVGDVNMDGRFSSSDLVSVFQAGHYEDGKDDNSSWEHGDWNCDGEFDSSDLVLAMQGGFDRTDPAAAVLLLEDGHHHDNEQEPIHDVDQIFAEKRVTLMMDDWSAVNSETDRHFETNPTESRLDALDIDDLMSAI